MTPGKYTNTNISERRGEIEEVLKREMNVSREVAVATGGGHLHRWELFVKPKYVVLHINPSKRIVAEMRRGDESGLGKIWESIYALTVKHISHLGYLSEWIDEVDSFCVSFSKIMSSREIAERFVADLDAELKRRFL